MKSGKFIAALFRKQPPASYWLTRFVILRMLGGIYCVAFWILIRQGLPLIGSHGLTPAASFLRRVEAQFRSRADAFIELPSIFWLNVSDRFLMTMAWTGFALSAAVLCGFSNAIVLALIWAIYLSFIH